MDCGRHMDEQTGKQIVRKLLGFLSILFSIACLFVALISAVSSAPSVSNVVFVIVWGGVAALFLVSGLRLMRPRNEAMGTNLIGITSGILAILFILAFLIAFFPGLPTTFFSSFG